MFALWISAVLTKLLCQNLMPETFLPQKVVQDLLDEQKQPHASISSAVSVEVAEPTSMVFLDADETSNIETFYYGIKCSDRNVC